MRTFRALGALLTYPEAPLLDALGQIRSCIAEEGLVAGPVQAGLDRLIDRLGSTDLMSLQEDYVALFDRTRSVSLYLYEHLHGESRERGQAMARLASVYRFHGFEIEARELPDYLPLVCEFLSLIDLKRSRTILADAVTILEALRTRLEERGTPYAAVPAALAALADRAPDRKLLADMLARDPAEEDDPDATDAAWAEEPVVFGPGAAPPGRGAGREQWP
jgi:nitrate reductase delta subunit